MNQRGITSPARMVEETGLENRIENAHLMRPILPNQRTLIVNETACCIIPAQQSNQQRCGHSPQILLELNSAVQSGSDWTNSATAMLLLAYLSGSFATSAKEKDRS